MNAFAPPTADLAFTNLVISLRQALLYKQALFGCLSCEDRLIPVRYPAVAPIAFFRFPDTLPAGKSLGLGITSFEPVQAVREVRPKLLTLEGMKVL